MLDIKKVTEEAQKELMDEKMKDAKTKVKSKLKELDAARKVVSNVEVELEDLYVTLGSK